MKYLDLCKRLRQEAGIAGDGPVSVTGQTGQMARVVGWVARAWGDIQMLRPNWLFMHSEFSFDTDAGVRDYLAADKSINDLDQWDENSFFIYEKAVGESDQNPLPFKPYSVWRSEYRNQMNVRADDRPTMFTILPDNKIRFEARPDKVYTIEGEYKRTEQVFASDNDTPTGLPDKFHMIIVWRALMYYGTFEDAPEVIDQAETEYDKMIRRLEHEQLPQFSEDHPTLA